MPELPEAETIRRGLEKAISGRYITDAWARRSPCVTQPRAPAFCRAIRGRRIAAVERRGKMVILSLLPLAHLFVRLGMTGRLLVVDAGVRRA